MYMTFMLLTQWLYFLVSEQCSLNGVFQPSSSFQSLKSLSLGLSIDDYFVPENPLFGLCRELQGIERSNSLEDILIKVSTSLRLQHDFLAELNDVLTLPGYTKLRRLCLEILLWTEMVDGYDREESRRELDDAAHAHCSQLFDRPSLNFSFFVAVEGIDDDDGYFCTGSHWKMNL
jgi:PleD family two-component response regulator